MTQRWLAFLVHLFTATGAFLAFLAMLAAMKGQWAEMFGWLGAALIVDGLDGPLARKLDVKKNAARWNGVILDLIVDYLTYVFIPAVALVAAAGVMDAPLSMIGAAIIIMTGAIYFVDEGMKTADNSFQGFPGCWNMLVLVLFATDLSSVTSLIIVCLAAIAQFVPLRFVHPVRTVLWRNLTLPIAIAWVVFAGWAAYTHFQQPPICTYGLMACSLYLSLSGMVQQILGLAAAR
ncbi:MAG: CDP-alcohol phosphatidyltransferase family protein [Pikeienuella sp.]